MTLMAASRYSAGVLTPVAGRCADRCSAGADRSESQELSAPPATPSQARRVPGGGYPMPLGLRSSPEADCPRQLYPVGVGAPPVRPQNMKGTVRVTSQEPTRNPNRAGSYVPTRSALRGEGPIRRLGPRVFVARGRSAPLPVPGRAEDLPRLVARGKPRMVDGPGDRGDQR